MNRQTAIALALLLSVALNLLAAGVLVGRKSSAGDEAAVPMAWVARDLDSDTRQRVRRRMRDEVGAIAPLRRELRAAHAAVRSAGTTEEYDPQAMKAALARLREANNRYQQALHENMAELASDLPREQRVALLRAALLRAEARGVPARPGA